MKAKCMVEAINMRNEGRITEEEFKNFLIAFEESKKEAKRFSELCLKEMIQSGNAKIYISFTRIYNQEENDYYNKCILKVGEEEILNNKYMNPKINLGLLIKILDAEFKSYGLKREASEIEDIITSKQGDIISIKRIYHP